MYRGLTIFNCTNCGHEFKSHDIEYCMTSFSVPQRCPNCGSIRTLPYYESKEVYKSIWEGMEQAEKRQEERIKRAENKKKAIEREERKRLKKKLKHLSQKQREAYDKKRAKKEAKRSKIITGSKPKRREEIILAGPTWFPPGTPLRIEES